MKYPFRNLLVACIIFLAARPSLLAQIPTPAPEPAITITPLGSSIFKWEDLTPRVTPNGLSRSVFLNRSTPTLERFSFHITTLNPGRTSHWPHRHANDEIIIVKEGNVQTWISGYKELVGPGALIYYGSNDRHGLINVGDTPATYWVINPFTAATRTYPAELMADPDKLASAVFPWEKLTVRATKNGVRRDVINLPTGTLKNFESHVTTLNVGEVIAPHRHAWESLMILKEGSLEVTMNGAPQQVGPGSVIFFASNDERSLKNAGKTSAIYFLLSFVTEKTPVVAAK